MQMQRDDCEDRDAPSYGDCERCGTRLYRYRGDGDIDCDCGAIYNSGGQRLRDDLYSRPNCSEWDDDVNDLEGYERAFAGEE